MTVANQLAGYASSLPQFRNRIINGDMRIDQRNAGSAVTLVSGGGYDHPADRWYAENATDGTASVQQVADAPDGFSHSIKWTVTSTDSSIGTTQAAWFQQKIEGFNFADMSFGAASAKTSAVSFWVKSSVTGIFGGALANSAYNRAYSFSYTINVANTWEYKTVTIAGDTTPTWIGATNGIGCRLSFAVSAGADRSASAGSWGSYTGIGVAGQVNLMATNSATFQITGVQLEEGTVATPFEHRPYGVELALCQRYYENNYPTGSAVGSVIGDNNNYGITYRTGNSGSTTEFQYLAFQTRKRSSPTLTAWNGVTGSSGTWRGSSNTDRTATLYGNEVSFAVDIQANDSLIRSAFYEANSEL